MNPLLPQNRYPWFVIFCFLGVFAIIGCNIYMLCCGRCVVNDFFKIPVMGWFVIAANLIAVLILIAVKKRRENIHRDDVCSVCCISLRETWIYCPNCGRHVAHGLQSPPPM